MQKAADRYSISILEALRLPRHSELDWLSFPPEYFRIDDVVGHGVKLKGFDIASRSVAALSGERLCG